jgi:hypothetical protein
VDWPCGVQGQRTWECMPGFGPCGVVAGNGGIQEEPTQGQGLGAALVGSAECEIRAADVWEVGRSS